MPIGQIDGTIQISVVDPTNPGGFPQNQPAATKDNLPANSVPVTAVGLLNPSGTGLDRQREAPDFPAGAALTNNPTMQAQMQIQNGLLRTLVLLMVKQNILLGGKSAAAGINADELDVVQWIAAGSAPFNSILEFGFDPVKLQ